ncbi:MAG: hypothetical protein ACFE0I_12300 [Elainellaceae cyanobacterium]
MQAVKVTGKINDQGQLVLDQPLALSENSRVEVIILVQDEAEQDSITFANDEPSKDEILADLKQAWHEAMTGQTIPVSQLWDNLDNE